MFLKVEKYEGTYCMCSRVPNLDSIIQKYGGSHDAERSEVWELSLETFKGTGSPRFKRSKVQEFSHYTFKVRELFL